MFGCGIIYTKLNIKTQDDIKCLENCYTFICDHAASNAVSWQGLYLLKCHRSVTSIYNIYKVKYTRAARMGYVCHAIQYINWYHSTVFFNKYKNR